MKFHPGKCKVLSVFNTPPPMLNILPFVQFMYSLDGSTLLDYTDSEKDLGVLVTNKMNWTEQCDQLLSRANQQLGIVKRNCYFVTDIKRRRTLYMALVRSQFENCSIIWRPSTNTLSNRFESLQKKAIKWILNEESLSFASFSTYLKKCKEVDLLPLSAKFDLNDILFLYKILKNLVPVELPHYLKFFEGQSRLRSSHLDNLSLVSSITPRTPTNAFAKAFFYSTMHKWNKLPYEIRELESQNLFKAAVVKHLWRTVLWDPDVVLEDDYDLCLENG